MATLQLLHAPILNSSAQVLILPVNSAGVFLDPILMRTKTLYPDSYQRYRRACLDSSLAAGSCLMYKRQRECAGLSTSSNGNQPIYIANLVISDHPYHPTRSRWLTAALTDLCQQLLPLIRYEGVRRIALLTRPLIVASPQQTDISITPVNSSNAPNFEPLDWYAETLPLLTQYLQALPKVRIDFHLPKNITI